MAPPEKVGEEFEVPFWDHQEVHIDFPAPPPEGSRELCEYTFHFDGACANGKSGGGLVAFRGEGV